MRAAGLVKGDHIAVMAENRFEIVDALWAALRTGGIITVVNSHLTAAESAYIVDDCDAKVILLSTGLDKAADWDEYEAALAAASTTKPEVEPRGDDILYSSGTTGRPKGVLPGPTDLCIQDEAVPLIRMLTDL